MKNPSELPDVRTILRATAFGVAGEAALDAACRLARVEHFKVATLLSAAGEQPDYLRLVVRGHGGLHHPRRVGDLAGLFHGAGTR